MRYCENSAVHKTFGKKAKRSDYYLFIELFQAQLFAAEMSTTAHVVTVIALR